MKHKTGLLALIILLSFTAYGQAKFRTQGTATLNDLSVTPGAVTGMTKDKLCDKSFHTGTIRNVPESEKIAVCKAYGIARADCNGKNYEIDHLISLELGGSNDKRNLWPESYLPHPGAKEKDIVENHLHKLVCDNQLSLEEAQKEISTNWYSIYLSLNSAKATK